MMLEGGGDVNQQLNGCEWY